MPPGLGLGDELLVGELRVSIGPRRGHGGGMNGAPWSVRLTELRLPRQAAEANHLPMAMPREKS